MQVIIWQQFFHFLEYFPNLFERVHFSIMIQRSSVAQSLRSLTLVQRVPSSIPRREENCFHHCLLHYWIWLVWQMQWTTKTSQSVLIRVTPDCLYTLPWTSWENSVAWWTIHPVWECFLFILKFRVFNEKVGKDQQVNTVIFNSHIFFLSSRTLKQVILFVFNNISKYAKQSI